MESQDELQLVERDLSVTTKERQWLLDEKRPLAARPVQVHTVNVAIDGDHVVWTNKGVLTHQPPLEFQGLYLLRAFVRLADAKEPRFSRLVTKFAERYGPLGLCTHGASLGHRTEARKARCGERCETQQFELAREPIAGITGPTG